MTIFGDIPYMGPPNGYGATSFPKRYIAIHNTSNDASAVAEATYARRRPDKISSHYYVDSVQIIQSLDTRLGANHAGSATGNRHAVSYEITGVNGWSRQQWLNNVHWPLLARQVARDCKEWGIPAQTLTVPQMRAGTPGGVVTHLQMGQAWGGTDHTDPGPNFPMDHLLALTRAALGGAGMAELTEYHRNAILYTDNRVNAILSGLDVVVGTDLAPHGKGQPNWLVTEIKKISAAVAEIKASPIDVKIVAKLIADELVAAGAGTLTPEQIEDAVANVLLKGALRSVDPA